jgi:hypothetical protein
MSGRRRGWGCSLAMAVSLVMAAGAPSARGQERDKPAPPLQGPKVTPNRPPELEDEFAPGGKGDKFARRQPVIPIRQYIQTINKLKGDEAPAELRLSDEQDRKIQGILDDFRKATQEFQRRAREEMEQQKPGDGQEMDKTDARPRRRPGGEEGPVRQRLEEFRRSGPRPQEFETRIWNVLTEGQQKFVQEDMEKLREEQRKRQGEEYMRREVEKRRPDQDGKEKGAGAPAPKRSLAGGPDGGPSPETRERVQRIFEKLRALPPEERERVLTRLEEELDRRAGQDGAKEGQGAPAPRKKRPAAERPGKPGQRGERPGDENPVPPGMDDVRVPKPDGR